MKLLVVNGGWREGEADKRGKGGGPRQLAVRSTAYCLVCNSPCTQPAFSQGERLIRAVGARIFFALPPWIFFCSPPEVIILSFFPFLES